MRLSQLRNDESLHASEQASPASVSRSHYVCTALSIVNRIVRQRHPGLPVPLPLKLSLTTLLQQLSTALEFDTTPVTIPAALTTSQPRREALRSLAVGTREDREAHTSSDASSSPGRTILVHGLLWSANAPKPLTLDERSRLRENFADVLNAPQPPDRPHYTVDAPLEANLPAVECKLMLAAIDHEDPLPNESLLNIKALWDTGAQMTFITDDILSHQFRDYVNNHEVHEAYRSSGGTRVQISCVVEFSNNILF